MNCHMPLKENEFSSFLPSRYGGLSFGERNELVSGNETQYSDALDELLVAANGGKRLENVTVELPLVLKDLEGILATATTKKAAKVSGKKMSKAREETAQP